MMLNSFGFAWLGAAAALAVAGPAYAQATISYDIEAQDLAAAIRLFAAVSGRDVIAASTLVAGKRSGAVKGMFSAEDAMTLLLAGTGLRAELVDGAFVLLSNATTDAETTESAAPDILVTGTRIRGAPVASTVIEIGAEAIRNAGQTNLGEVARSVPQSFGGGQNPGVGFNAAGSANLGSGSSFNLRGLGSDATLTLLNGRRMPYSSSSQSIDVSAIPLAAVERIELVPDGASALYGSDAVAGVVNILLRRPFDGAELRGQVGQSTDGGNVQQLYGALAGQEWESGGLLFAYEFERNSEITSSQRDYAASRPGLTIYPAVESNRALGSLRQSLTDTLSLAVDGLYNHRASALTYPLNPAGDLSVSRTRQSTEVESYATGADLRLDMGSWRLALTGTYGEDRTGFRGVTTIGGTSSAAGGRYTNRSRSLEVGGDGPLLPIGAGVAQLAVGAGIRINDFDLFRGEGAPQNIDARQNSRFAYGELSLPLLVPEDDSAIAHRLNLSAALRHERYRGIGGVTTPKLGLIYAPSPDLDLKASWGRSFRAPTFIQQFQVRQAALFPAAAFGPGHAPGETVLLLVGGNPDLRPERARTWSATLSFHPDWFDGATLEIGYFSTRYIDRIVNPVPLLARALIDPLYVDQITRNPGADVQAGALAAATQFINVTGAAYDPSRVIALVNGANVNAGRQRIHGVDALFSWRRPIGGGNDSLGVRLDATWLDSEQQLNARQPSQQLAGTLFNPPHFRTRGMVDWRTDRLTLAATLSYTGGVEDPRTEPPTELSSMTTLDLIARYRDEAATGLLSGVEVNLGILNIFNAEPDSIATTNFSDTPYDSTNYSPAGRVVSVGLVKRW